MARRSAEPAGCGPLDCEDLLFLRPTEPVHIRDEPVGQALNLIVLAVRLVRTNLALALLALLLVALVLSAMYSVPSTWRVLYYSLAFVGPSILFATGLLAVANAFTRTLTVQLTAAFAGSLIGLAVGFVVAVYVLGVW